MRQFTFLLCFAHKTWYRSVDSGSSIQQEKVRFDWCRARKSISLLFGVRVVKLETMVAAAAAEGEFGVTTTPTFITEPLVPKLALNL